MHKSKTITNLSDIPIGNHWAILTTTQIHIPGDERSRTNPGHGYPASTETHISYEMFLDEGEWRLEVEARTSGRLNFVAIAAKRPVIKTRTFVDIS